VTGANSKKNYSIGKQCTGIGNTNSSLESGSEEDGKTPQQVIHSKRQISSKIIEGPRRKAAKKSSIEGPRKKERKRVAEIVCLDPFVMRL
jgi:hypothetical protein